LPAVWIDAHEKERAEISGYNVVDPTTVIITHLTEVVRRNSDELLSRQAVHELLDNLKQTAPKLVDELVPDVLKVAQIHQVLCNLLHERIPVRNLEAILEALGDYADKTKDLGILTEYARHALSRTICQQYRDANREMPVVTLDPALEDVIHAGVHHGERGMDVKLSPQVMEAIARGIADTMHSAMPPGRHPIVLVSPHIRAALRQMTEAALPNLVVMSLNETTRDTHVEAVGQVGIDVLNRNRQTARAG
jgi:flagellar biosynthesis protein FlhA